MSKFSRLMLCLKRKATATSVCGVWVRISHAWNLRKETTALQRKLKENNVNFILFPLPKKYTTNDENKIFMQIRWEWSTSVFKVLDGTNSSQNPSSQYKVFHSQKKGRYDISVFTTLMKATTYVFVAILIFPESY